MRVRQRSLFVKNAAFCEGLRLIRSSHLQRWRSFSERFVPRMIMPENLQNEQSSCSFSRANKQAITSSYYKLTWKPNANAEKDASAVKRIKNRRKQNFEDEASNLQLDKEDTRRSNWNSKCVLLSWFFYLFLLCSISLLVKYAFILRYKAWVNL